MALVRRDHGTVIDQLHQLLGEAEASFETLAGCADEASLLAVGYDSHVFECIECVAD